MDGQVVETQFGLPMLRLPIVIISMYGNGNIVDFIYNQ